MSFVLATGAFAQQNLGNLESFVNQEVAYEDAGIMSFGDGSGDYYGSYNDATLFDNELFDSEFEDADADLFMSSTISLTTTTPKPSTTTTTTTTSAPTPPPRSPERMDARLRGRPERPRFFESSEVEDAGLFDYYGDAMFGFDNYDGTDYEVTDSVFETTVNNRPNANVNQQKSGSGAGYCRICSGEDAAGCAARSAVQCGENQNACLVRIVGSTVTGYKFYSQCSTESVCHDTERQNFVGSQIYHQCKSSNMGNRFLRNSVCSMCYKQADANDAAELFFAAANTINRSTTTTISTTDLMAAPATYLTFGLGDYLYAGQNW